MSTPTLDPAPSLRKHLDAYATVSDAHRTTHKELKEYAATVEQMRALLASVQALPDAYGDQLMGEVETRRLRQEQDAMMRTLRATRRALGLGKEDNKKVTKAVKPRAVRGVTTSKANAESDVERNEDTEKERREVEADASEAEAEESKTVNGDQGDSDTTSESVRDTAEDRDTYSSRTSSGSSEDNSRTSETVNDKDSADLLSYEEDARASTSAEDDSFASASSSSAPSATASAHTPNPKPAAASRRSKLAPPRKVASTPAATPTPAPAAEDVRILPLPTAHHRAQDARLKRLKMLQARTGRPVFVSDRAEGAGGRRRRRREVRRGWRGEGRV